MNCAHTNTVESDMTLQGVNAIVTICTDCGTPLDRRRLRPQDMHDSTGSLPPEEARIQADAAKRKAKEVLEESGEEESLPFVDEPASVTRVNGEGGRVVVHQVAPSGEEVAESLREKVGLVTRHCSKHGGAIQPCDEGEGKAHHCTHSKWGKLRTFDSPCPCLACHARKSDDPGVMVGG